MSPCDLGVVQSQHWIIDPTTNHAVWLGEVVLIMAISASECDHRCNGVPSAASASRSLLVIGPRWRHVPECHARQSADVDTYLHCRCARQDIYGGSWLLARARHPDIHILEEEFVLLSFRKHLIGLGGIELGGVLGRDYRHRSFGGCCECTN